MTTCRYCGEWFIGDRDGIGMHVSSVLFGLLCGAVTMLVLR